ncbi:MAG TPA: SLC13 family permease [Nocardioidaceae bacterium]|nr:SLC13 family permease [Nocardioidaceae bacterium]
MSIEIISSLVLVAIFVISTTMGIHMGALAITAAFIIGVFVVDLEADEVADFFPGDLFIILAGVTFLFAIARANGTIDYLVRGAVSSVGGRLALIPWVFFFITAILTAVGSVVPAAVAIIAPIGLNFAKRFGINPLLMGLMVINGATAGGFSPISIFGSITNGVVQRNELAGSPIFLFVASFVFNFILGLITFALFGGRKLLGQRASEVEGTEAAPEGSVGGTGGSRPSGAGTPTGSNAGAQTGATSTTTTRGDELGDVYDLNLIRALTIGGILLVAFGALFLELDAGFTAFAVAVGLSFVDSQSTKGAVNHIAWPTVLLVCGIVTYVTLLEEIGTVEYLGDQVASMGAAMFAALLILYIGGVVSAFASTTGILGALIPLAVPFLQGDNAIGAIGLITALAISSSVVDSSPFSTSGSLVVANSFEEDRDFVFKRLMQWGFSMVALAPPVTWLILVVPGWL